MRSSPATASPTNSTARAPWRVIRNPTAGIAAIATPASGDHTGTLPAATSTARTPATPMPIVNRLRAKPSETSVPTEFWESGLNIAASTTLAATSTSPIPTNVVSVPSSLTGPRRPIGGNRHAPQPSTATSTPAPTSAPLTTFFETPSLLSSP